ncbi:MAG: hypothetical protein HQK83_16085 [Fibrobacteria bacterium]|nr:hypothetical protein [Fibrobacteria bacterium]
MLPLFFHLAPQDNLRLQSGSFWVRRLMDYEKGKISNYSMKGGIYLSAKVPLLIVLAPCAESCEIYLQRTGDRVISQDGSFDINDIPVAVKKGTGEKGRGKEKSLCA